MKIFTHFLAIICIFASGSLGVPSVHILQVCGSSSFKHTMLDMYTADIIQVFVRSHFVLLWFLHWYIYIYILHIFSFSPSLCLSLLFVIYIIIFLKCANRFYRYCLPTTVKVHNILDVVHQKCALLYGSTARSSSSLS